MSHAGKHAYTHTMVQSEIFFPQSLSSTDAVTETSNISLHANMLQVVVVH